MTTNKRFDKNYTNPNVALLHGEDISIAGIGLEYCDEKEGWFIDGIELLIPDEYMGSLDAWLDDLDDACQSDAVRQKRINRAIYDVCGFIYFIDNPTPRELFADQIAIKHGRITETTDEDGTRHVWLNNDILHCETGPAVQTICGIKEWWLNGSLHRINGPAIESENGIKEWFKHGLRHRSYGPAIDNIGDTQYWLNGKKHRLGGPAVHTEFDETIYQYSSSTEWWLDGKEILHPEEFIFCTIEEWIEYLNDEGSEDEICQAIHDYNGFIMYINNPTAKQLRLHQITHLL